MTKLECLFEIRLNPNYDKLINKEFFEPIFDAEIAKYNDKPMTPQELYKETQRLLDAGEEVMLTRDGGDYMIISPTKDFEGDYRNSDWCTTKESAKANRGDDSGYTKEEFLEEADDENWKIVSSIKEPDPIIEVGTKVKILAGGKVGRISEYNYGTYEINVLNEESGHTLAHDRSEFSLYLGEEEMPKMPELQKAKEAFDTFCGEMNKLFK